MLLLLLSFYVHYELLNCEEIFQENFNESSLVDNHRRVLLQVNSLLKDLEQNPKKLLVFNGDDYENDIRRLEIISENISSGLGSEISGKDQNTQNPMYTIEPPPVILPSYVPVVPHQDLPPLFSGSQAPPSVIRLDSKGLVKKLNENPEPDHPRHQLIPINSIYPALRMAPSIFSKNSHYVDNNSYPLGIFKPIGRVRYEEPPSVGNFQILPLRPIYASPSLPNFYVSGYTPLHDSTLTTTIRTTTISSKAKSWFNEIAPYTSDKKKNPSEDQSRTTVPIATEPRNDWSLTGSGYTAQLFHKKEYEYLQVAVAKLDVRPDLGITPKDPHENSMTTAGDVLYGRIKVQDQSITQASEQRLLVLMEQLKEGYLMVFTIELFRMISVKAKHEVLEVLAPMKTVCKSMSEDGRLDWVDDPLLNFIEKLSTVASSGANNINVLRTYSSMMFHSLLKRTEMLSDEINSIIDHAELFFSDEEGRRLLRSLTEFEDYPNTSTPSYIVCANLIENILQPFRRPKILRSRDRLLESVNRALRRRFPLLSRKRIRAKGGAYPSESMRNYQRKKKARVSFL